MRSLIPKFHHADLLRLQLLIVRDTEIRKHGLGALGCAIIGGVAGGLAGGNVGGSVSEEFGDILYEAKD